MSGTVLAPARARSATIRAVVTRADGRVEDLGVVSYWHRNPVMRAAWRVVRFLRGLGRRLFPRGR